MERLRNILFLIGIVIMAAGISWLGMTRISVLGMMERWVADVRVAALMPAEVQHADIVVVAITEETLQLFPYRSPIDRAFLANLLQALAQKKVRAVLLDVLLDQPTEPEKDNALREVLKNYTTPLVVSYVDSPDLLTEEQLNFLHAFVPKEMLGLADLGTDPLDGVVRWIFPGKLVADGHFVAGVTALLVSRLGVPPPQEMVEIAWRGAPQNDADGGAFRAFPAHLVPVLPEDWLRNKVVLIGMDTSLADRHRTPFSVIARNQKGLAQYGTAGIYIFAHSVAQLLEARPPLHLSLVGTVILLLAAVALGFILVFIPIPLAIRLFIVVIVVPVFWLAGFYLFQKGWPLIPLLLPTQGFLFSFVCVEIYQGWDERKKRNFLKRAFSRYISPELVDLLVKHPDRLARGALRRELTFIFTDIEGFTTVSEQADPAELAPLMNVYFDEVCSVVLRNGGMVVDLIGDAVFAMFNAPLFQEDHAKRAVNCVSEIQEVTVNFQQTPAAQKIGFGRTRIGVHTGTALVGNFGAEERFKYTPLGDAVNVAARIEGLNKYFKTNVCASGRTIESSGATCVRPVGDVVLKGKSQPITIFEIPPRGGYSEDYLDRYRSAFRLLGAGDFQGAEETLIELSQEAPNDGCVTFHLERLQRGKGGVLIVMDDK